MGLKVGEESQRRKTCSSGLQIKARPGGRQWAWDPGYQSMWSFCHVPSSL